MKKIILSGSLAILLLGAGCGSPKNSEHAQEGQSDSIGTAVNSVVKDSADLEVKGKVINLESGKDGYTATIQTQEGKEYTATISRNNLSKSGGEFKQFEKGDDVAVKGTAWSDQEGKTYVTVTEILASDEVELSATGKIVQIENGKDGYLATIRDEAGKEYTATISIINLQKSGGQFKKHEVGETISVKGKSWKDEAGKTYITVSELK